MQIKEVPGELNHLVYTMNGHNMKQCSSCHKYKELKEFNKNINSKDGLYHRCRLCHKFYNAKWYKKNRFKNIARNKKWKKDNKLKVNKNRRVYCKERYYNDINYKLACSLRTRLNIAIERNYKAGSAVRDLGCSIDYFKQHIETQFQKGMSWSNRGRGKKKWHIDHIKPLSGFDLADREQFLEACHYTNQQPMWSMENILKGVG